MKYNIPHCHLTCVTICPCPPWFTREARSVLYMTCVLFTVPGTWRVTVTAVDTGIFTTFNTFRNKLNKLKTKKKKKKVSPYLRYELNVYPSH